MPILTINNLTKSYKESTPIRDVSFEVNKGDVISIIGPSGTGKSTLIRCLNMLEKPTGGQIILEGCGDITAPGFDLTILRKRVGMVFQSFNLFDHRTVVENIMMAPMDLLGMSKQAAYDRAMGLLRRVGLESQARKYPNQLSGGQKQRVAIARTLAMEPEVILFDEPTSALDPLMVGEVMDVITQLAKDGTTMMVVTHEMSFARNVANRIFYLDQGGIYEQGSPADIFDNPQRERTRLFVDQAKQLKKKIVIGRVDYATDVADIEDFCKNNSVDRSRMRHLENVYEELAEGLHALAAPEGTEASVSFSYSSKTDELLLVLSCSQAETLLSDYDNLSVRIIQGLSTITRTDSGKYRFLIK